MGLRWVPTWKSLPNQVCDPKTKKRINSCFLSLPYEFAAYLEMADEEISLSGGYSYQLAYPATLFAYDHKSPFHQYSNMVCLIDPLVFSFEHFGIGLNQKVMERVVTRS